jgi:hypothetical protein
MPNLDPIFLPSRLACRFLHENSYIIHPLFPVLDLAAVNRNIAASFDTSRVSPLALKSSAGTVIDIARKISPFGARVCVGRLIESRTTWTRSRVGST